MRKRLLAANPLLQAYVFALCSGAAASASAALLIAGRTADAWFPAALALAAGGRAAWTALSVTRHIQAVAKGLRAFPEARLPLDGLRRHPGLLDRLGQALEEFTDRHKEEMDRLQTETNRLMAVLTSIRTLVVVLDENGRVVLMNPAAESVMGAEEKHVLGKHVLHAIRHHELANALDEAHRTGEPASLELETFGTPNRFFQADLVPVTAAGGDVIGTVAALHDVTELRRLEQARSQFIANVSHELRTPITSIKGFVETLLEGAMEDPHQTRRFLQVLEEESGRLEQLVEDLLDLSTLRSRAAPLETGPTDVRKLVEDVLVLMRGRGGRREIELRLEAPDHPVEVEADGALLRQAMINLVDNAVNHSPDGGAVEVRIRGDGGGVELCVADEGSGIPSEHLELVFERFYRVEKDRSRARGGTGLGLSIVKEIVERHDGRVWAESELGRGSRFYIWLPLGRQSAAV